MKYFSGDLDWCGVRTTHPIVSHGTGVLFSLLSAIFIIFNFNHSFQNLNALYLFALELFCFLNLFYFVKSCLRYIVIISIFNFFFQFSFELLLFGQNVSIAFIVFIKYFFIIFNFSF
jgi:hypothetical protein